MNIYSIYLKDHENDTDPIIIKQGFSFIAALLNVLWAVYYKLWIPVIIGIVANTFLGFAQNEENMLNIAYAINFGLMFVFGFFGGDMREYYAEKKGYVLKDIIAAYSETEAETKFAFRLAQEHNILTDKI